MTEIHPLRAAGIAAIAAAALGSVLFASPASSEVPSTGTTCSADASGNWVFRNCAPSPGAESPDNDPARVSAP